MSREVRERDGGRCVGCGSTEDVWACHMMSWSRFPHLRYDTRFIVSLCPRCDPDRNPAARPAWWGQPGHANTAGYQRRHHVDHPKARAFGRWLVSDLAWYLVLRLELALHAAGVGWTIAPPAWSADLGARFFASVVLLWVVCAVAVELACRHRVVSRAALSLRGR